MEKRIEDYVEYDETSSTCLRWKKSPHPTCKVGDECFKTKQIQSSEHTPYYTGNFDWKSYNGHQVVWYLHHKEWSTRQRVINHKDGNGLNNKIDNLEMVSPSKNSSHLNRRLQSSSKTKVRGVTTCPKYPDKYVVNYKSIYRGRVNTLEEGKELWMKCHELDKQGVVYKELTYKKQ